MRIAVDLHQHVLDNEDGIARYTKELLVNLAALDPSHTYFLLTPGGPACDIHLPENFHWLAVKTSGRAGEVAGLENLDLDIYFAPKNGIALTYGGGYPFVATIEDLIPWTAADRVDPAYREMMGKILPQVLARASLILTISAATRRDIVRYFSYPQERIVVTPLGVSAAYTPRSGQWRAFIKERLGLPEKYILNVSSFNYTKNQGALVEAFYWLLDAHSEYETCGLVLVGKKVREYFAVQELVDKLGLEGKVFFPGYVPDAWLPYVYSAAQLFVYPTLYEGFGLPALEAMACGVPVIASNRAAVPDVVGEAGLLVDPQEPHHLARAMHQVLANPQLRQALRQRGRKRSRQFSWRRTAYQTLQAFYRLETAGSLV